MDLDELQSVQNRERQTDSLQSLRSSFYEEVGEYIQHLREERERVAERKGFDAPEFRRLSDEIDAAEDTVESVYERRVGKIVKAASFAAAGMPADDAGLTDEEQALFDRLVADIEGNREYVLDVLTGEVEPDATSPSATAGQPDDEVPHEEAVTGETPPAPELNPTPENDQGDGVDAADMMGEGRVAERSEAADEASGARSTGSDEAANRAGEQSQPAAVTDDGDRPANRTPDQREPANPAEAESQSGERPPAPDEQAETPAPESSGGTPDVDRSRVLITRDVGEILGVDERAYDLGRDDVVDLPEANATPLVERDAAERLE